MTCNLTNWSSDGEAPADDSVVQRPTAARTIGTEMARILDCAQCLLMEGVLQKKDMPEFSLRATEP